MKKCPQCNSVFTDDNRYCLNDGTILVEENLPLPTTLEFEEPTQIKNAPIVVDIAPPNMPPPPFQNPTAQKTIILNTPPPKKKSKTPKYAIFLVLGLLLGGGLVFGAFLAAGKFYQNADSDVNSSTKNKENNSVKTKTSADDSDKFNGKVIAINANLRSEPGLYAEEIGVLPIDESINIIRREHDNSPWYYVEAENGASGWIHGNTIEFTK